MCVYICTCVCVYINGVFVINERITLLLNLCFKNNGQRPKVASFSLLLYASGFSGSVTEKEIGGSTAGTLESLCSFVR